MMEYFEPIFHKCMFAYRKFHVCPNALLVLTERCKEELDKHNKIGAVTMDLSKVFDCLPHELILEKLKFYGLDDKSVNLLGSYLSNRKQRRKLHGRYLLKLDGCVSRGTTREYLGSYSVLHIYERFGIRDQRM